MKHDKFIKGSFGNKKIYFSFLKSEKKTNLLVVFCHGVFSSSYNSGKYSKIANKISSIGLADVLVYESSRTLQSWEKPELWEDYIKSFSGKTFDDELFDLNEIFESFTKDNDKKILLVGSSLGGTLASYLLPKYSERIAGVVLLGSGITTLGKDKPILSTYPPKEDILKNYEKYKGVVTLVQDSTDFTVPIGDARKIIFSENKSFWRELVFLNGVDHTFSLIHGKPENEKLVEIIFFIIKMTINKIALLEDLF